MELVHIYIEEHKALHHLNIPINGEFECSYKEGHLTLKKRNDHLSDYYKNINISAIVGKNGTGKTTILNFLETLVLTSDSVGIVIFFCRKNYCFHICNINSCNLKEVINLNETDKISTKYELVSNHKEFIEINKIKFLNINNISPEQSGLILSRSRSHSSILNLTLKNNTQSQSLKRQYFSKLLNYFKQYSVNESFQDDIYFELSINSSPLRIMYRAIDSASDFENSDILQEKLKIWSQSVQNIKLFNDGTLSNNLIGMNVISILSHLSKLAHVSSENQNRFLFILLYTFSNIHNQEASTNYHSYLKETIQQIKSRKNWLKSIADNNTSFTNNDLNMLYKSIDYPELTTVLDSILEQLFLLSKIIKDYNLDSARVSNNICKLEDYFLINSISELVDLLPNEVSNNIRMGWRGISTGELAYSHIFSETFHHLTLKKSNDVNYIIIIDEVDLYLHPEWQRGFVANFIKLINFCHNKYDAPIPQVILTTHSPIIIGDFLPRDITSLYKEKDESSNDVVVVKPSLGFGTSISDLYLTGMHLDAIFGEHSKGYIDNLIQRAKENKLTSFDKKLIEQISDKHIKNYLLIS